MLHPHAYSPLSVRAAHIVLAAPDWAAQYDAGRLSASAQQQAARRHSAKAQQDWQVSRALLQAVPLTPNTAYALSHSHGHAALFHAADPTMRLGVDLERIKPRQTLALAEGCCSAAEYAYLARLDEAMRLLAFYRLWTLKEALLKATGLAFPADLRRVGWGLQSGAAKPTVRVDDGSDRRWHAYSAILANEWALAAVWLPEPHQPVSIDLTAFGDAVALLPPQNPVFWYGSGKLE